MSPSLTAKVRWCLQVKPFHVATTLHLPSALLFRTHGLLVRHTHRDTLPCVRPCVSWCPGLWHLLCVACDRLEMWQLSLCQTKSGQSHNTQTHSSKNATYRLYCRASTEEVRALCPPSSPNFKCHAQLNGAAWLTAELLCRDMSSFYASSFECPTKYAWHSAASHFEVYYICMAAAAIQVSLFNNSIFGKVEWNSNSHHHQPPKIAIFIFSPEQGGKNC